MKIQINKPCHEDWSKMTAEAQGKFCNVCEKSVVDFSEMSDAEILYYFSKPKSEKVCGRFNVEQLERPLSNPIPKVASPSTQLLQFAYVLVVVLGVGLSSCGETVKGKVLISKHQDSSVSKIGEVEMGKVRVNKPQFIQGDTIVEDRKIMGECVIPDVIRE